MPILLQNSLAITARVYRGNPPVSVYGPVRCSVQPLRDALFIEYGMQPQGNAGPKMQDISRPTHSLKIDLPATGAYTPLIDVDEIFVAGSGSNLLDGYYSLVEYPKAHTRLPAMTHLEMKVRYLGAKKFGDSLTGGDNSGNIILQPRG